MTIVIEIQARRSARDVARLYVEARVAGLEISHYPSRYCKTFDGLPEPGCDLGVFRSIGSLIYYKDERRWEVRARADAGAVDLATLVDFGLAVVAERGRAPGQWVRKKEFEHFVSKRTGKRIATARVCYRLGTDDLLASTSTAVGLDLTSDIEKLLTESTA